MDFNETIGSIPDHFILKMFPEEGLTVTGESLRLHSSICAAWIQEQGYKEIGIHMENCPEFLHLFAGAMRAGVKVVIFNLLNPVETHLPLFDRARVRALLENVPPIAKKFSPYIWGMDEPIVSMFTSGTSGQRKLIDKSVRSIFRRGRYNPKMMDILTHFSIKVYNCSPWYHSIGFAMLLASICGARFTEITNGHFNPDHTRRMINSLHPLAFIASPTMLHRCVCTGDILLPSYILLGGENLSDLTIALMDKQRGWRFMYSSYGMTEAGIISHIIYLPAKPKIGTRILHLLLRISGAGNMVFDHLAPRPPQCAGRLARHADVRIMKDGKYLGEGETGEIVVRTRQMYVQSGTGYFHTGDAGYLKDGLLFVCGRETFVINRSGEKILPRDIEQVLAGMPGVKGAVVFGIPSETHGEDICAAIESENGVAVLTRDDLQGRLPKHMIPQHIYFYASFPLTESGKADVSAIRDSVLSGAL